MSLGLVGSKCGMTRVFTEEGHSVPVTVIQMTPNRVTQIKSSQTDHYCALQLTAGEKKPSRINKPQTGHFAKAKSEPGRGLWEFRVEEAELANYELGAEVTLEMFEVGQKVDVQGVSKGKGFAGVVKRHNFRMQDATHGNSLAHRAHGSTGQCQDPGKVFKGKKMAGQMGSAKNTVQNLEVIEVDTENHLLLVKGAIPGAPGNDVLVYPASKTKQKRQS